MPRDLSLFLTMDRNIHLLTRNHPNALALRIHQLYLFLNLYNWGPYLLYTFAGDQYNTHLVAPQHLTITTSLPSSLIPSKRPQRQRMTCTTSHTPHFGIILTFLTDSVQHQMTILTLAAHIILSILVLYAQRLCWNIVRCPHTHEHTIHLLLATLALKRYHPIWFTNDATPPHATLTAPIDPLYGFAAFAPASRTVPTPQPTSSPAWIGNATQLLIPSLLSTSPSTKRPLPPGAATTFPFTRVPLNVTNSHDHNP